MVHPSARILPTLTLAASLLAASAPSPARGQTTQRVDVSGNVSYPGHEGDIAYGYSLGYLRTLPVAGRLALWVGIEAASLPEALVHQYVGNRHDSKLPGTTLHIYEDTRLLYLGIPAELRYESAGTRFRPYISHGYRLHAKLTQAPGRMDSADFHICRGTQPRPTCVEREDFSEIGFPLLVLKTTFLFGATVRLGAWAPYWEAGLLIGVTPTRQRTPLRSGRTRALVSAFGLGF